MWSSPLFTNTSKRQLPVEQFSQKTNEKRAEDLLYCTTEAACTVEQKLSAPACGARGRWRQTLLACTPSGLPEPHVSSRHPWEEYRVAPFPVESDLVLPTSHPSLELDGGWRGPGGHSRRGSQGPGGSRRTSIPAATAPQPLSPSLELAWDKHSGQGTQPLAASGQNCRRLHWRCTGTL